LASTTHVPAGAPKLIVDPDTVQPDTVQPDTVQPDVEEASIEKVTGLPVPP
jgi:hypothetical protein